MSFLPVVLGALVGGPVGALLGSALAGSNRQAPRYQQQQVPTYLDPNVTAAGLAAQRAAQEAKGRGSTILTGGMGDTSSVQTARKATLGA